jgi:prefoldin beta subunit
MTIDKETEKKIEELQILEHRLQEILMERQNIQIELNGIENAIDELDKTSGDVYKILSGVMVKSNKEKLAKDLEEKKKFLDIKLRSVEKQSSVINSKSEEIRKEIQNSLETKK